MRPTQATWASVGLTASPPVVWTMAIRRSPAMASSTMFR